ECKSSVIKINNTQEINIPVMAENQKKLLEKQGYDFSGKLEEGRAFLSFSWHQFVPYLLFYSLTQPMSYHFIRVYLCPKW
ncbi:hypothetical protein OFM98_16160, partial [Acinetobacter baumannii]|nr:hypothetical protein [Acinetobacter baumannii]